MKPSLAFHRSMDVTLPVRRETPHLAMRATACAVLVLVGLAPLGVPRLSGAHGVAAVLSPGPGLGPSVHVDFLSVVLGRVALQIPVGDLPLRLAMLSGVLAAVALGLWARAGLEVACLLRPPARARVTPADVAHEPVGVLGAACAVGVTTPFFTFAADAAVGGASLVLLAAWTWTATLLIRDRRDGRAALGASFLAGVAVVSSPQLGALLMPCGLALWIWGLSHRARWILLAPVLFVVGGVLVLPAVVLEVGQAGSFASLWDVYSLGILRRAVAGVTAGAWSNVALQLAESLGVVGALLAAIGCGVLAWRAPAVAAVVLFTFWASVTMAAASPRAEPALSLWLGLAITPIAVGLLHFAAKLGRARVPAAWCLVVLATIAPLLAGGVSRWLPDGRLPLRLLSRAQAELSPRSVVDPGSHEMHVMFRYGESVGFRPDVIVSPWVDRSAGDNPNSLTSRHHRRADSRIP